MKPPCESYSNENINFLKDYFKNTSISEHFDIICNALEMANKAGVFNLQSSYNVYITLLALKEFIQAKLNQENVLPSDNKE